MNGVIATSKSEKAARLVLMVLADHENEKTGLCCPSTSTLMIETGLSRAGIQNARRALVRLGEIKIVRQGGVIEGELVPNHYEILLPKLTSKERSDLVRGAQGIGPAHKISPDQGIGEGGLEIGPSGGSGNRPKPEEEKPEEKPELGEPEFLEIAIEFENVTGQEPPPDLSRPRSYFRERLKEGFDFDQLVSAVHGAHSSDWAHEKGLVNLTDILSRSHIERWIDLGEDVRYFDENGLDTREAGVR